MKLAIFGVGEIIMMKLLKLLRGLSLTTCVGALALALQPLVAAETIPVSKVTREPIELTNERTNTSLASTTSEWLSAQAEVVEITTVEIEATADGFIVRLDTDGELSMPVVSVRGNAAIANIPNAVLNLPKGEDFLVSSPAEGIALVSISALPDNRVQVAITGADAPPTVDFQLGTAELIASVVVGDASAQMPDEDAIQLTVTGEQIEDDYFVPNASTATRTDTPILEVPASIQVIPRQILEDQQVTTLDEALTNVSGVTEGGSISNSTFDFNIRGFDNAPVLRDGFRQFGGFGQNLAEVANLERIEVLRGPASILYGEIQPGGVINLVTKEPLSEPFADVQVQTGNLGLFRPQVDVSGPLTEDGRLLYRLNALYQTQDSIANYNQDFERFFVAPVISGQISDHTDLTVRFEYTDDKTPLEEGLVAIGDEVADVPLGLNIGELNDSGDSEFVSFGYDLNHQLDDNWQFRNAFRYTSREVVNIGAIPFSFDEANNLVIRSLGNQSQDAENYSLQTSLTGDFATGSLEHTLLFGVDVQRTRNRELTGIDFANPSPLDIFNPVYGDFDGVDPDSTPIARNTDIETDRLGIYLQDQIEILDDLILLAGLRYDTVNQESINGPTAFSPATSKTNQNDDAWTPRIGIVYQPLDFLSLFASYSQSFTPSTALTAAGAPLEPERSEGFDVGIKAEMIDGDLLATLTYFDINRQNVATPDPADPFSSVATGEQRSQGVELDLVGEILPGWNVIASYAYTDARVTEDNTIPAGNRLFNAPANSANLWTTYEIQTGDLEGLGFGLGFNFVGEREGDLANSFDLDSYFLTNAAVSYRRNGWRFALNARNLFDVDHFTATANRRSSGIEPGDPFTIVGSVSVEF